MLRYEAIWRCNLMRRCEVDSEIECKAEGDASAESEGSDVIAGDEKKLKLTP